MTSSDRAGLSRAPPSPEPLVIGIPSDFTSTSASQFGSECSLSMCIQHRALVMVALFIVFEGKG